MHACFDDLAPVIGIKPACSLLGLNRASMYRRRDIHGPRHGPPAPRPTPPNALTDVQRAEVLEVLHAPEHVDLAVPQVWTRLLDAGVYLCSMATMYRILAAAGENGERRRQRTHPAKKIPQLHATGPNQVWSWDITRLPGPTKGVFFDLYVILDVWSRYVIAWTVAPAEDSDLAKDLIADAIARENVQRDRLTLHADRGSSMTSKTVAGLLVDLGVTRSHSRPRVSNDNPFSESQFRTLKYCPAFPGRFDSIAAARDFCRLFFDYYNLEHRHSGIALHTPVSMHRGTAPEIRTQRQATLDAAREADPIRFSRRPIAPRLPEDVWINKPAPPDEEPADEPAQTA